MSNVPGPTDANGPKPRASSTVKVLTAARAQPLSKDRDAGDLSSRIKEGAEDAALNTVAVLKDGLRDLAASNRFFKYKVLIIGLWATLSIAAVLVVVLKTSSVHVDEILGARLILGAPNAPP